MPPSPISRTTRYLPPRVCPTSGSGLGPEPASAAPQEGQKRSVSSTAVWQEGHCMGGLDALLILASPGGSWAPKAHDADGNGRSAHDALCHAAEQRACQTAPAVGAHHEQGGVRRLAKLGKNIARVTLSQHTFHADAAPVHPPHFGLEGTLG